MGKSLVEADKFVMNINCLVVDVEKAVEAIKNCLEENELDHTRVKIGSCKNDDKSLYELNYSAIEDDQTFNI